MNTEIVLLDDEALDCVSGGNGGTTTSPCLFGLNLGVKLGVSADVSLGECQLLNVDLGACLGLNLGL